MGQPEGASAGEVVVENLGEVAARSWKGWKGEPWGPVVVEPVAVQVVAEPVAVAEEGLLGVPPIDSLAWVLDSREPKMEQPAAARDPSLT